MRPKNEIRINMAPTVCYLYGFVDWFSSDIVVFVVVVVVHVM